MTLADAFSGRSIVVTGGRGYLGSSLATALCAYDCCVVLVDRSPANAWSPAGGRARVRVVTADLSRPDAWQALLSGTDIVFHLAGIEYSPASTAPLDDWRCNALPVTRLLAACRAGAHRPRIVAASSANLFGRGATTPIGEGTPDEPLTLWSANKLLAERELRLHAVEHGVAALALRLANVYGPSERPGVDARAAANRMARDALRLGRVVLRANSACVRDFLFIDDAVRALLLAATHPAPDGGYRVVGTGVPASFAQLARAIAARVRARTGRTVAIVEDAATPCDAFESRNFVADAARFSRETAWSAQVGLEHGIGLTLDALEREARPIPAAS